MIFEYISIENFMRFKEASLPLRDQGLVLIEGANHDSTAATSNGSGKSTIFEAIVWCLWGKTVRGYSGDRVVNRTVGKDCAVRLKIAHEGKGYTITRYRRDHQHKNNLYFLCGTLDLTEGTPTMTQQKITEWLGVDFDTYIRGPMIGQGHFKRFSQMTDAEQKSVLETALQVGILSTAQEVAKEKVRKVQLQILQSQHRQIASKDQKDYLQEKLDKWESEYRAARRKFHGQMKGMYSFVVGCVLHLEHAERELEELPEVDMKASDRLLERLTDLKEAEEAQHSLRHHELTEHLQKQRNQLFKAQTRLEDATAALTDFQNLLRSGQSCPTCRQTIDEHHAESCLRKITAKISECEVEHSLKKEKYSQARKLLEEQTRDHETTRVKTSEIIKEAQSRREKDAAIAEKREYWLREIRTAEATRERELERFRSWVCASTPKDRSAELRADLEAVTRKLCDGETEYEALQSSVKYLEFWEKGFGNSGMKSLIFDSIVPFLNDRARQYTRDLTDSEVKIEFSTKTKLKSGQAREKFSVLIDNVNGAGDYMGGSGGEQGRIDLAINFALSDLMTTRAKKSFPQRFFDEPFEGIDEAGLEAVTDLLYRMVKECGTIFVVTHRPTMAGLFDKTITVHKKNGVSYIESEN